MGPSLSPHRLQDLFADSTDVTLADEDNNSIPTDDVNLLLSFYFLYPFLVQVWLAGGTEQSARPTIPAISPAFVDGTYMVCFSDLWRCTEQVLAQISSPRITFYTRGPIWMLDATKEIVCPDVAYVRSHPGFFCHIVFPHLAFQEGGEGFPSMSQQI